MTLTGHGTNFVLRTGLSPLAIEWQIALDGSDTIAGTLSDGSWTAAIKGDRLTYHATLRPSPYVGRYTFAVPGVPGSPDAPEGDSYGSFQISTSGQVVLSGSLAENIKFTQKTAVSRDGLIPLYYGPYLGRGLFTGWIDLNDPPATTMAGDVTWIKPSTVGGAFYPAGFTNDTALTGSRYVMPASTNRIIDLVDALLTLSGGNLSESLTNRFGLAPGGKITNGGPHTITLKFVPATGLFNGTLKPTNTTTVLKFNGVVLQSSTNAAGYVLGTNKTGRAVIDRAPPP
jgi:hypothetical protein